LWNRTFARAIEQRDQIGSSTVASSLEQAIFDSEIIWSCFSNQEAVLEIFENILKTDVRGKLFLECSTITPDATNELARKVIDAGAEFVAMPGMLYFSFPNTHTRMNVKPYIK
jgi:3-hydroxyisobutyrate dehydrogenase-like beta-hydroxyacid dehydrogenase